MKNVVKKFIAHLRSIYPSKVQCYVPSQEVTRKNKRRYYFNNRSKHNFTRYNRRK